MLFIISLRNLIARSSLPSLSLLSYLPSLSPSSLPPLSLPALLSLLHQSFSPAVVVLCSECAVDWLKHAFITKFNHIRPGVYGRFVDVLCKDLVTGAGSGGGRRTHEGEVRLALPLSLTGSPRLKDLLLMSPSLPLPSPFLPLAPLAALRRPVSPRLAPARVRRPPARVPRRARHQPGVRDARRRERRRRVRGAERERVERRRRGEGSERGRGRGPMGEGGERGCRCARCRCRLDVVRPSLSSFLPSLQASEHST